MLIKFLLFINLLNNNQFSQIQDKNSFVRRIDMKNYWEAGSIETLFVI